MNLQKKIILHAVLITFSVILIAACGKSAVLSVTQSNDKGSAEAEAAEDKAAWQSQMPEDGGHVEAGSEFDITWYMVNTGTTTWTTDYAMRYFAGTNLTKPGKTRYSLTEEVKPGETGAFNVDAIAPWEPGTYQMFAVLSNGNDENFSKVDITIVVDQTEEK